MRKITDIYQEYKLMPNLQLHQLRVAAVAKQICESFDMKINTKTVVAACLLHDMGNIIKFDLNYFPDFLEPQGIEYWQNVKKEYVDTYGPDEHHATIRIAQEVNASQDTLDAIDAVGFHNWQKVKDDNEWIHKIASYADSRVAPYGVASLDVRLADARKRYENHSQASDDIREMLYACIHDVESQIFSHSTIAPSDIADESIVESIEALKHFEI